MKLTPQQEAILSTTDISVGVSAGAGCGKTFVLTERFMGFLRERVDRTDPLSGIVAITFTNKAAREMRQRVRQVCRRELAAATAEEADYWIGVLRGLDAARISTIHSFASSVLRRFSVEARLDPAFGMPESSLNAAMIQRAAGEAVCALLEQDDPDARALVLRFGLERTFELAGELVPGLRLHHDRARFEEFTPEELWDRWLTQWHEQCIGMLCRQFQDSPARLKAARLLAAHEPNHPKMIERRQQLLRLFDEEPTRDPIEWLEAIEKAAQVKSGGGAKAWDDPAIYEEIKNAFAKLRDETKKVRGQLETAHVPDHEATTVALQADRLARRVLEHLELFKQRESFVEFDDLLIRTRDLLRDRPDVLRRAAAGLELLMVDEFQDTDPVQAEIVRLLCGEELKNGRLFLVGDAKQSIYRFRGADPGVFSELRTELPPRGHLPLSTNFRSQPAILDFVNYTFETEIPDYEPLQPSSPQVSPKPAIEFLFSQREENEDAEESRRQEATWIAARLAQLLDDTTPRVRDEETGRLRPVQPGDVAILFRGLTNVHFYEQALSRSGIPYYLVKSRTFFAQQEIQDIAHLCRYLEDPGDELSLVGVLRSPLFGLTDDTLLLLKPEKKRPLAEGLARPPKLPEQQADQVRHAHQVLNDLRNLKEFVSLVDLLNHAIEKTGYDAALLAEHLGARKLANLRKLVELARSFSANGPVTLTDFAGRLQEAVLEETDEEVAATHPEIGDVLRLMTIHQAKGLEFPVVILADMEWKNSGNKSQAVFHPDLGPIFAIPDDGPKLDPESGEARTPRPDKHLGQLIQAALQSGEEEAELTRLLYVALTRPRDHLILAARFDDPAAPKSPWMRLLGRRFNLQTGLPPADPYFGSSDGGFPETRELPQIHVHRAEPVSSEAKPNERAPRSGLKDFRETVARATPEPLPGLVSKVEVNPAHKRLFTATELTDFDYESQNNSPPGYHGSVSRASATKESSPPDTRTVGNIVHHALEHIDFAAIDPADEAALDVQVERSMEAQRAGTDTTLAASAKRRMKLVLASPLPNILVAARNLRRELNFRMLWPPGETDEPVEIVGVIDGLYQDSQDRWHIYDYKITGQTAKEDADLADRYELQIFLYAMAIERALGIRPASAELIRLDNELTRVPVPLDEERLYEAEERIDRAILNLKSGNDEPPS